MKYTFNYFFLHILISERLLCFSTNTLNTANCKCTKILSHANEFLVIQPVKETMAAYGHIVRSYVTPFRYVVNTFTMA